MSAVLAPAIAPPPARARTGAGRRVPADRVSTGDRARPRRPRAERRRRRRDRTRRHERRAGPVRAAAAQRGAAAGAHRHDRRDTDAFRLATDAFSIVASAGGPVTTGDHAGRSHLSRVPGRHARSGRTGAGVTRSPTARTADRATRSRASCPTTARTPAWRRSRSARRARRNTTRRPTGASTRSRTRVRCADRSWRCGTTRGQPLAVADPLAAAVERIRRGGIVAIKGLGGFHLVCDARNAEAVAELRRRKQREEKPFAVMVANLASIVPLARRHALRRDAAVDTRAADRAARQAAGLRRGARRRGARHGIARRDGAAHADAGAAVPRGRGPARRDPVARRRHSRCALVMTSANPGGEPLVIDNDEARAPPRADRRRPAGARPRHPDPLRRQRGARRARTRRRPSSAARAATRRAPIRLAGDGPSVLAVGAYLKNTVCVTRGDEAFLSQHIGSLDNAATCVRARRGCRSPARRARDRTRGRRPRPASRLPQHALRGRVRSAARHPVDRRAAPPRAHRVRAGGTPRRASRARPRARRRRLR